MNLVDVTRMSLDDVVIIMSIPRRLVLATRQKKGMRGIPMGQSPLLPTREAKPPPVVVIKKHFDEYDQDENGIEERRYGRSIFFIPAEIHVENEFFQGTGERARKAEGEREASRTRKGER